MMRREFLTLSTGMALAGPRDRVRRLVALTGDASPDLAAVERRVSGRLGVAALDTATGRRLEHRARERFPMCSTFKWLLATEVLSRVDHGVETLDRVVPYGQADLLDYAPITRQHVSEGGMRVSDLLAAAIEVSDNTAANLLLASAGGPAALTAFIRRLGDPTTRLDRNEPSLNTSIPGDPRDTTTPAAMVADLQRVLLGRTLSDGSREHLVDWLARCTTGGDKLRAGLPAGWRVGDKTGSGQHGSTNDVAIAWPQAGAPILVAAYLTQTDAAPAERSAALASVGEIVGRWVSAQRH